MMRVEEEDTGKAHRHHQVGGAQGYRLSEGDLAGLEQHGLSP